MKTRRALFIVPVGAGVVAALLAAPAQAAGARPHPAKVGDFNGDGRRDVAVGAPGLNGDKGAVVVHLGGPKRVAAQGSVITRSTRGVPGNAGKERFGERLASADFDRDGYADLAVGVPGFNPNGQVVVLRGSKKGVTGRGSVALTMPKDPRYTRFGDAMAVGDFNADGYPDLAAADRDRVRVFRGGPKGLSWKRSSELRNGQRRFGRFLASGDINGDRVTDLVVVSARVTPEDTGGEYRQDARITVIPGHRDGLRVSRSWFKKAEGDDPWSISVADVDRDGRADIVTSVFEAPGVGWAVEYRRSWGNSFAPAQRFQEYLAPVRTALGDLNGDGHPDLAVRSEDRDSNAIVVFTGGKKGFKTTPSWSVPVQKHGLYSTEAAALSIMNVSGGSRNELLIGDTDASAKKGAVLILHAGRDKNAQLLRSPWKTRAAYGSSLVRTDGANSY